jgi:hypothetical protein
MVRTCVISIFLFILMTSTSGKALAQWAQTIGWGGAGLGKRAHALPVSAALLRYLRHPFPLSDEAKTNMSPTEQQPPSQCEMDENSLKEINRIIQVILVMMKPVKFFFYNKFI